MLTKLRYQDILDLTIDKHKKKQVQRSNSVAVKNSTPTPTNGEPSAPSAELINTWRKGGANLEPSAKMVALIRYLKEWEYTGDKTIVYSQCTCNWLSLIFPGGLTEINRGTR